MNFFVSFGVLVVVLFVFVAVYWVVTRAFENFLVPLQMDKEDLVLGCFKFATAGVLAITAKGIGVALGLWV